mmetsp:Transcript_51537/g.122572  ORF Transcript_51537/g.122572 Transcript_51537/m.122572 type:complete len:735 (-) Transcript_51537:23-2227(-)
MFAALTGRKDPTITEKVLAPRLASLKAELTDSIEAAVQKVSTVEDELRKEVEELHAAHQEARESADEAAALGQELQSALETSKESQQAIADLLSDVDSRMQLQGESLEKRAASLEESLSQQLKSLQEGFAQEVQELRQRTEDGLQRQRAALEAAASEQVTASGNRLTEAITSVVTSVDAVSAALEEHQSSTKTKYESVQLHFSDIAKSISLLQKQLNDEVDDMKFELKQTVTKVTSDVSSRAGDLDSRLERLDQEAVKLRNGISEVENASCRRIEWVIKDALDHLHPPTPEETRYLHTSYFSPQFDACGAFGLQLELQIFRKPPDPMLQDPNQVNGDCAVFLWACAGTQLAYRLSVGSCSSLPLERKFNGRVPYGTGRLCFFKDHVDPGTGTLQVAVDVLECVREFEKAFEATVHDAQKNNGDLRGEKEQPAGFLRQQRHVNYRTLELVMREVERMKSRMVHHVEWRVKRASQLRQCFPKGDALCSPHFSAAGVERLQLLFYPQGYTGAGEAYCSIFLQAPAGCILKCTLKAGKEKRDVSHSFDSTEAYGRTNFCRFDTCIDEADDTVLIRLDIEDAHQDIVLKASHVGSLVKPGDVRTLAEIEGAGAVESAIKLRRTPGRVPNWMEEVKVLPSLWAPKGVGHVGDTSHGFMPFEKLDASKKRPATSGGGSRSGSPGPGQANPAMRSRPRTATGISKSQSHSCVGQLAPLSDGLPQAGSAARLLKHRGNDTIAG